MNFIGRFAVVFALTFLLSGEAICQDLRWNEIENGIWKASVGEPEDISLLKAADIQPKKEALQRLPKADFPLLKSDIKPICVFRYPGKNTYSDWGLILKRCIKGGASCNCM